MNPLLVQEFFLEHEAVNFPLRIIFFCNICQVLLCESNIDQAAEGSEELLQMYRRSTQEVSAAVTQMAPLTRRRD